MKSTGGKPLDAFSQGAAWPSNPNVLELLTSVAFVSMPVSDCCSAAFGLVVGTGEDEAGATGVGNTSVEVAASMPVSDCCSAAFGLVVGTGEDEAGATGVGNTSVEVAAFIASASVMGSEYSSDASSCDAPSLATVGRGNACACSAGVVRPAFVVTLPPLTSESS